MEWGFTSIDGSKFLACNSKNHNFTKNKIDDRIKWINGHIEEYLRILDHMDKQEDFEEEPDRITKELMEEEKNIPQNIFFPMSLLRRIRGVAGC